MKTLESLMGRMGEWYNTASSATYALAADIKGVVSGAAMGTVIGLYLSMGLGCSGAEAPDGKMIEPPADAAVEICQDNDHDGFFAQEGCGTKVDCNDYNNGIFPNAEEECQLIVCYADGDNDGYGNPDKPGPCGAGPDGTNFVSVDNGYDCDDTKDQNWRKATVFTDNDGDGRGAEEVELCMGLTPPPGYTNTGGDCDDTDPELWQYLIGYLDQDGDYWGSGEGIYICSGQSLHSDFASMEGDCQDQDGTIHPGALDFCDTEDNDCNPATLDGSGVVVPLNTNQLGVCEGSFQQCINGQWQDNYTAVENIGPEICDWLDNDCDDETDQWTRWHNGSANSEDVGNALVIFPGVGVGIAGEVTGEESQDSIWINYNFEGDFLSSITSGIPGSNRWHAATKDSQGNIFLAGVKTPNQSPDLVLAKYDQDGNFIWERTYNGAADGDDGAWGIVLTAEEDVLLGGTEKVEHISGISSSLDVLIMKYASDGTLQWTQRYNSVTNSNDRAYGITTVPGIEDFYVTGESQDHFWTAKYDSTGTLIWMNASDGSGTGNAITADPTGNAYATGTLEGDLWVGKYSPTGTLLWSQAYNGPSNGEDMGNGIFLWNGTIGVLGYVTHPSQSRNGWFATYDQEGGNPLLDNPLIFNGPANGHDEWRSGGFDPETGGLILLGGATRVGQGYDIIIRNYVCPF